MLTIRTAGVSSVFISLMFCPFTMPENGRYWA